EVPRKHGTQHTTCRPSPQGTCGPGERPSVPATFGPAAGWSLSVPGRPPAANRRAGRPVGGRDGEAVVHSPVGQTEEPQPGLGRPRATAPAAPSVPPGPNDAAAC